jgi:hypothetical protein
VLAAAATLLLLPGCATTVVGTAAAPQDASTRSASAAMPTTTPPPVKPIPLDRLVRDSVRSTSLFWQTLGIDVDVESRRVDGELTCAGSTSPGASAVFCATTTFDLVRYSPTVLGQRRANGGDLAVRITIAHEVGHAARLTGGVVTANESVAHAELSSDCAAGAALSDAGVDRADAQTAIRATALGANSGGYGLSSTQRTGAFFDGFDGTVSPMGCLSYEG